MTRGLKRGLFVLFLASGFCGLLYQIVWIRLALAAFGVITPVVSVVVSVFMLGLSLGSWLGGRWIGPLCRRTGRSALLFYAAAEVGIALGAFALPTLFEAGRALLLPLGAMDSTHYLLLSAVVIVVSMLPWCFCMGVTYPFAMAYIREQESGETAGFSFLYLANVIGAMLGASLTSLVLIELAGFSNTLGLAGLLNLSIAGTAVWLWRRGAPVAAAPVRVATGPAPARAELSPALARVLLFTTGFAAMALEIVWVRAFTPVLGTLVYAFSGLLTVYLLATWLGSLAYRRALVRGRGASVVALLSLLALTALLPNLASDTRVVASLSRLLPVAPGALAVVVVLASIFPLCALLGYLTPKLIDGESAGSPERAGLAYALNIVGSILGPLAAAYLLLPELGARISMLVLASPFLVLLPVVLVASGRPVPSIPTVGLAGMALGLLLATAMTGVSFEEGGLLPGAQVRRDHTATVISFGEGLDSHLVVNGHGMTTLSALTKVMAHLPLASLPHEPERALVIAFGMGTTYRSLLTWDIRVTAVELVPSVVDAFDYYFADASRARNHPRGRIVIDDGRRFLARTSERFDVITLDPPPPVEAAGSSLLYSEEFYALVQQRLAPGGILQQWFPNGIDVEPATRQAVLRAVRNSFPHVRIFRSLHGPGLHILCSLSPIEVPDAAAFAAKLPGAARRDLLEWAPARTDLEQFISDRILAREIPVSRLLADDFQQTVTDDRPFNEYFVLRRFVAR